jgi:uncharacterized protein (TIGR03437 family)
MKRSIGYIIVLTATMWGQAVSPRINAIPTRQFGHPASEDLTLIPTQGSPNLVEGREFDAPGQIAFDNSVNPPIMYVADIGNNRVLGFKSVASLSAGNHADLVIGQQDFFSTTTQGPGTLLSTGFNSPTGIVVDKNGNLYVADAGNNRILRFPAPFSQAPGNPPQPDLVIGQKGFNTGNAPNEGGNCASKTLAFSYSSGTYIAGLAVDATGNLWTTDPLNNRVLMYPVANLSAGTQEPVATVVLGQNDFTSCGTPTAPQGVTPQLIKNGTVQPSSLAFDSAGNLYIADAYSRVLYFTGPNFSSQGQAASRVLGVAPPVANGQPATVYPNQYSLGAPNSSGQCCIPPNGVFTNGTNLFVADTPSHRIVMYDVPTAWAAESTSFPSPAMKAVYGQVGFTVGQSNQGQPAPNQFTLASPFGGGFVGTQMWISDSGNHRVLAFSPTSVGYTGATVVVGQLDYIYNAPNLIVGSEVFLSGGLSSGSASGIVVDKNSNPPHLYIADPGNNRILCFMDARKVGQAGALTTADLVIGQPDLKSSQVNYPNGKVLLPSQTGLFNPIGVAVDNNGNLYVADYGNARVVRFPAPFSQPGGVQQTANLVLGQSSFTSTIQNASSNSMHSPWGLALFASSDASATPLAGGLAVSDPVYNRILLYKKGPGGDFQNGQNAYLVIGQSLFSGVAPGTGAGQVSHPLGIASDTSDRLYVADYGNSRIMIFDQAPENLSNGPTAGLQYNGISAEGVAVSSITTELWITNTSGNQIFRFPEYTHCVLINCTSTATLSTGAAPLGIALDATDNVIIGDTSNRITFYFAQAFFRNAANYNIEGLAPGTLAILGRLGLAMNLKDGAASAYPWPTTLSDLNVTVNGTPAPIFGTISGYGAIKMQVPQNAPTSGTASFMITQASTGAVLGVGSFQMAKANPGFFSVSQDGLGQLIALNLNPDGSSGGLNSPANQVARGGIVEFCLTGQGQVSGAPPDGQPPPGAPATPVQPTLVIGSVQLTSAQILYSGLGCGFPGGWQINATVPITVAPGTATVALLYDGVASNIGGTTQSDGITPGSDQKIVTTISVK